MNNEIVIDGSNYNLEDLADLKRLQNKLVPDNWTGTRPDAVRHAIALRGLLLPQLAKHLFKNFAMIAENAIESETKEIDVTFKFGVNMSVPTIAAITDTKMSFSVKYESKGKAMSHDLNQPDLPLLGAEDLGSELSKESEAPPLEQQEELPPSPAPDEGETPPNVEPFPDEKAGKKKGGKKK